jgi:hypothetical protein
MEKHIQFKLHSNYINDLKKISKENKRSMTAQIIYTLEKFIEQNKVKWPNMDSMQYTSQPTRQAPIVEPKEGCPTDWIYEWVK